ncbi:thioredoxin fold domain-containing protein [candidate division KSB1 bacterium]|nr:thioredoxin fold domain-containing protein [candidate division KSB1 bacterium]
MSLKFFPFALFLLTVSAVAQLSTPAKILDVQVASSQDKIIQGTEFKLAIILNIEPTMHINSNNPGEFFIPTEIKFTPTRNLSFGQPQFPPPTLKAFSFSEEKLSIYDGKVVIVVPVSTSPALELSPQTIKGAVSYQGCTDNVCFAPEEQPFEIVLEVVAPGTAVQPLHPDYFSQTNSAEEKGAELDLTQDERTALQYVEKGMLGAIVTFFVIGLALNLTPCVYPVIPLTVSYFSQRKKSKGSAFVAALFYQIGIALAFAALGLISGLAGKQWGFLFASPWFVVVIGTIILLMAASLFGAFEITVPSWLLTKVGSSKEGAIGAFVMGLTAGVVIAPCAAGIIIGLVGLIAKLGLVVKGTILFFVLGLGLGLPYLILATFSGLLGRLPQSGGWMVWIKKVFGFMLIGVAIYFILPQLERVVGKLGFLVGLTSIIAGFLLGFLEHGMYGKGFNWIRKIVGVILIVLGIVWIQGALQAKQSEINWVHYQGQSVDMLLEEEKPIFIDFYADWCAPCKQLDRHTFTDRAVTETAESFIMLKVDCTTPDDATQAFMDRFRVTGMPTLVFLTKSGDEIEELREIGFVPADKLLASMQKTLEQSRQ